MKLLLFDIDGTLLLSGGAGKRGMNRAFADVYGIANALDGVRLSGMTDKLIFRNACVKHGVEFRESLHEAFVEIYLGYLQDEITRDTPEKGLLPGVEPLLKALAESDEFALGLLTGNYSQAAKIKLGHFHIDHFFAFGAFGDDAEDRNALLPFALKRFHENTKIGKSGVEVWVIGDTPNDIACARPYEANTIAVATGEYSAAHLAAEKPTYVLPDFRDMDAVLKILNHN